VASLTIRAAAWLTSSRGFLLACFGLGVGFFAGFFMLKVYAEMAGTAISEKIKLHHYLAMLAFEA
jgi:hypothetical protein